MAKWLRFVRNGQAEFGTLDGDMIAVHVGDMFSNPEPTGERLSRADVALLTPTSPGKMIGLWNNFRAFAQEFALPVPEEPLYFLKAPNSFLASGRTICRPKAYDGPVVFEGELGIVIGRECKGISEDRADDAIFGYTCVNDVTAARIIDRDPNFAQWVRAKSYDGFGVFGPVVATGIEPGELTVRTVLNGDERQNYPISDMIFPPRRIVSLISRDMTLEPGDVIACGTSLGVGSMKQPSNRIDITIEGIGTLSNEFVQ